jgi:Holliday junction resolvase-like predicted endonuclease
MSGVNVDEISDIYELKEKIIYQLKTIANKYLLNINNKYYDISFDELIKSLHKKYNRKVVILIDEYDAPIINVLENTEKALKIRGILREFYRVIKSNDEYIKFAILTGVSRFSKAGVFSSLNNLNDITIDTEYALMLGISQNELESYFSDYIKLLADKENISYDNLLKKIKFWYNGFCFDGETPTENKKIYNPFSTLLLFQKQKFHNYWFESGTPKFLIDLILKNEYDISILEKLESGVKIFESYEPDRLTLTALLFQTGYISLKDKIMEKIYILSYPNYEVKKSFLMYLIDYFKKDEIADNRQKYIYNLLDSLKKENIDYFIILLKSFFSSIPYDISDRIKNKEQYYQTVIYIILALLGVDVGGEVRTSKGRIDLLIETEKIIWIIEIKIKNKVHKAIRQIEEKEYTIPYIKKQKHIKKIGIVFDVNEKNIKEWNVK